MQERTIKVEYSRPRGYDVGYRAENNFTVLALPVPEELEGADSYRVYFESTAGEYLQTELLTPTDGYVTVKITSDIVPEPGNIAAQLVAFADGKKVGYAPVITGTAKVSIPDGTERLSHSLAAEIALNTAARHTHANKSVLDKFAETDGKPTYDGKALGGGASTAEDVSYTNTQLPNAENVKTALDELVPKSHTHANKDTLDKLSDANGKLQYNGSDVALKPAYYIDLAGTYPNYTCPVAMDDIKAAYNAGYNLVCRCTLGAYTATLPLFIPMPTANTWIFSGSGELQSMGFVAQSFSVGITANRVVAQQTPLNQPLQITVGNKTYLYNGSKLVNIVIDGITPTIGDNGNWYLGGTDTGKPSRGEKGDKGDTPVKGTDYWTTADKAEIVKDTLAALPKWTGGSY